jgi:hypothetical protein
MKRLFILFFLSIASAIYSADFLIQWYIPSSFGFSSGGGMIFHQFEDREIGSRAIIPFEAKAGIAQLGEIALSVNGIISVYMEDEALSSINTSLGLGIRPSSSIGFKSAFSGLFFSLYPLYEAPLIAFGKTPVVTWKGAFDIGCGFEPLPIIPLYIGGYIRLIFVANSTDWTVVPDAGLTCGWRF